MVFKIDNEEITKISPNSQQKSNGSSTIYSNKLTGFYVHFSARININLGK